MLNLKNLHKNFNRFKIFNIKHLLEVILNANIIYLNVSLLYKLCLIKYHENKKNYINLILRKIIKRIIF